MEMMMINCYIVNRQPEVLGLLSRHVSGTPGLKLIGCNSDPVDAVERIGRFEVVADMVFMDGGVLRERGLLADRSVLDGTQVVFSSADSGLAALAFDWDAADYLPEPVSYERFMRSIGKVRERLGRSGAGDSGKVFAGGSSFFIQSDGKGKLVRVDREDIVFVEGALNYLRIHLQGRSHVTYLTIREMQSWLDTPRFVRVHKSFLVNLDKVESVEGNMVRLSNGETIVVGPTYRTEFFGRIGSMLLKGNR